MTNRPCGPGVTCLVLAVHIQPSMLSHKRNNEVVKFCLYLRRLTYDDDNVRYEGPPIPLLTAPRDNYVRSVCQHLCYVSSAVSRNRFTATVDTGKRKLVISYPRQHQLCYLMCKGIFAVFGVAFKRQRLEAYFEFGKLQGNCNTDHSRRQLCRQPR